MTSISIKRIADSERALSAGRALALEYMCLTGNETNRGPWNQESDLPIRLASELSNIQTVFADPGAFFVVFVDGEAVGCAGLHQMSQERADIRRLYVRQSHRGRGLARLLMQACLNTAREGGFSEVVADVVPSRTDVIEWYRRLGFVDVDPFEDIGIEMVYLGRPTILLEQDVATSTKQRDNLPQFGL